MNTGEKPGKILIILNKIPVFILASFISCILFASLFARAEFCGYKFGDNPVWSVQNIFMLAVTIFFLLCGSVAVCRLCDNLANISRRQAVCMILYLSVMVQIFTILYLPAKQFADQNTVNTLALNLIKGNYSAFGKGGYLYLFPNNVGITLFLSAIYRIFPDTMLVPKLLNVLFSTAASYFIFRIYEEACRPERGRSYGILVFSGFFLPMILLNNLVYNDVYATALFAGFVYCCIRFVRTGSWNDLALSGIFVIAGNFLRQVGILFIIAAAMYFIIRKISIIKSLAYLLVLTVLLNLPMSLTNACLLYQGKIYEPIGRNSIPVHMWVHIGMNEEKIGYWDNSRSYNVYVRQGKFDKEKSAEIYTDLIIKNIRDKGLLRIGRVYVKKNVWLWTEGTYQAEYYGIGTWGYLYPTLATKTVEKNVPLRDGVRWILHTINLLMMGLIAAGLIRCIRKKTDYPLIFPAIILVGFICFYTIWEIKPRYIYPIYPYLILMFYYGLGLVTDRITRGAKRPGG